MIFFSPTLGENFGHVIFESLAYGTPVLCSGNTPWDKLDEFSSGWNFNLNKLQKFIDLIEILIPLDNDSYNNFSKGCSKYIFYLRNKNRIHEDNAKLFY